MTTDDDNWRCVNCGEPEGEDGQLPCGHPFGLFRRSDPDNWKLPGIDRLSTIPSAGNGEELEIIARCEGCGAPFFADDDYAVDENSVAGCWATMTDDPVAKGRPCYAKRVGKPSAAR